MNVFDFCFPLSLYLYSLLAKSVLVEIYLEIMSFL